MRIHKERSLAHAEGWTKSLSGIGHIGNMLQILFRRLEAVEPGFVLGGSGVMPYPLKDTTTSHEHGT